MTSRAWLRLSRPPLCKSISTCHRPLNITPILPHVEQSHLERPLSGTHQNRYAVELIKKRQHRRLAICLLSAAEMKQKGVAPNLLIYNSMLDAVAEDGFWLDAWAILDDMLRIGIKPNTMSFNYLLHVRMHAGSGLIRVFNTF